MEKQTSELIEIVTGEIDEDDLSGITTQDFHNMFVAPTDWTIGVFVDLLKKKKIDLTPSYQRRIAWNEVKMSRFIESLFMRLPVPQIVLAELSPGKFAVIDGKQRINSIARFCIDTAKPLKLQKCEYLKRLNGLVYSDIEDNSEHEEAQDSFLSHTIRTIVIKNWRKDDLLYLLFLRLNQSSVTLSTQELRRALSPGEFMNWLDNKTSDSAGMKRIFEQTPDFRMRDMELGLRHLAFRKFGDTYSGNMKKFLDDASKKIGKDWKKIRPSIEVEWENYEAAIELASDIFDQNMFESRTKGKYQGSKNRAVMDVITYYFAIPKVRELARKKKAEIKNGFEKLSDRNIDFQNSIQVSTKTKTSVNNRFSLWGKELSKILKINLAVLKAK